MTQIIIKDLPDTHDSPVELKNDSIIFEQELEDYEKFFIQYNNVPIDLEIYGEWIYITVLRRRFGIPSTLNIVNIKSPPSPFLQPFPDSEEAKRLISVYRPEVDVCKRLWMVDTGLLEVPGARKQIQPPAILAYDLTTMKMVFRYELEPALLVNEKTSAGLTSITVEAEKGNCGNAYAYINDLATEGMVVFSLSTKKFWRINHPSFIHDEASLNFTVAGNIINWKDGLFSIALSPADVLNKRRAYYHPLATQQEFSIDTQALKDGGGNFDKKYKIEGVRGPNTQSGSHVIHAASRVMFYANIAQDAILCWNIDKPLRTENVAIVAQDHEKLIYIADLVINVDNLWALVNQITKLVFSLFNKNENNFFLHRGVVQDLIRGTVCEKS